MKRFLKFTIYICVLTIHTNLFVKYGFVAGKQISPYDVFKENDRQGKKSQLYKTKIHNFQKSQAGKNIMMDLNILTESFHEISAKAESKSKNNVKKKEHYKEAVQYIEFLKKKSDIKTLLNQIKEAVKVIYMEETTAVHEKEEIEEMKNKIEKKKFKPVDAEKEEENSILEDKDEVKNAVILDNLIKVLKSLKQTLTKQEYNTIMNNKELLLKKLLRADVILDDKEFNKFFTGINSDAIKTTTEFPRLNFDEEKTSSFLEVDDKSPNYCTINDIECDRRKFPDSCESRMPINNQGTCGSSWAFAALQNIEFSHCLASGKSTKYSRQEIIDCSTRECLGGFTGTVTNYLLEQKRIAEDSEYLYEAQRVSCRSHTTENVWTGSIEKKDAWDFQFIINRNSTVTDDEWNNFMKNFIIKHGAIVVYLFGYSIRYAQDKINYLCEHPYYRNHAVIVTGWKILNGVPVWIMRNSWGPWWADEGYTYIAMHNNCPDGYFPLAVLHVVHLGKWSDEISPYKVIETQKNQNMEQNITTIGIGEEKMIACNDEKRLHIIRYNVVLATGTVSDGKLCDQLDLKNKCENQVNCLIYFPQHTCDENYNTLNVKFECITGASPYDCTLTKSSDVSIPDEDCIMLCRITASKCSPVTKECLDSHADAAYCNFDKVPNAKEEQKEEEKEDDKEEENEEEKNESIFDCLKAIAKTDSSYTQKCIEECKLHADKCPNIECLYEKLSKDECDLSNILVREFDCTKAVASPDKKVSNLCVEHCKYFAENCNSPECLYKKIPDYACDLSQIF